MSILIGFDIILGNFKLPLSGILKYRGTLDGFSAEMFSGYIVHSSLITGTVVFSIN